MKHSTLAFRTSLGAVAVIALLALVLPAFAGGWAVATLDQLPDRVVAGEPITVGFVVRQHGIRPAEGLSPQIRLQKAGVPESKLLPARAEGEAGHYVATFTFPEAGEWNWSIETDFWPERQPMPALTVLARGTTAAATTAASPTSAPLSIAVGIAGILGVGIGLIALVRTKAPWAAAVVLLAGLVSGLGFASAAIRVTASESTEVAAPEAAVAPESQAELGQRLFIAKGCVVCHTHDAVSDVKRVIQFNFDEAPDLTSYTAAPDYLSQWLADPKSIKPKTYMPQLNLSDDEIQALVVFINTSR